MEIGETPERARTVLPSSTKTEIVVTMNMREWRHFFLLRAIGITGKPHPQMQEVALPLLMEVADFLPELFGDIAAMDIPLCATREAGTMSRKATLGRYASTRPCRI